MSNGRKTAFIIIRVDESFKRKILTTAGKFGKNISDFVRDILETKVNEKK